MSYATHDDVFKRYNPIRTLVGTTDQEVSTVDISSIYISDAENFVNAYIGVKYITPVWAEPLITQLSSDIAIFKILEDRAPRIPEFMDRRYANAVNVLEQLRDGKMVLTSNSTANNSGGNEEAWSNVMSYTPVFEDASVLAASCYITNSLDNCGLI